MMGRTFPNILITAALAMVPFVLLSVDTKRITVYDLAAFTPYLVLALVAFLGEKLNQRRILFASLTLAVGCAYLTWELPTALGAIARGPRGQVLAVAMPLVLFLCFSFSERWLRGPLAPALFALALAPLALVHTTQGNGWMHWLVRGRLSEGLFFSHLSNAGVFLAMLFAGLAQQTEDRYLRVFRYFLAVSLVPLYYVFERTGMRIGSLEQYQLEVSISFLSCAAVLVYACFYLYWQKVYLDELTGIPNRRALNERMEILRHHYTIGMVDIDHFKRFNDTYGHEQGDNVLRFVAKVLADCPKAQLYRYGGEEFVLIFENTDLATAQASADTVRAALERRDFYIRSGSRKNTPLASRWGRKKSTGPTTKVQVTVSIGLAAPQAQSPKPRDTIAAADQALYKAKSRGRNRVVAA